MTDTANPGVPGPPQSAITIAPIDLRHVDSFGDCLAEVARERKYLAIVDGFSLEQNAAWVAADRSLGNPFHVALDGHRVVDGAGAARFNAYLAQVLADFRRVLL